MFASIDTTRGDVASSRMQVFAISGNGAGRCDAHHQSDVGNTRSKTEGWKACGWANRPTMGSTLLLSRTMVA
eukprot:169619-Amphidinium_carterae.2